MSIGFDERENDLQDGKSDRMNDPSKAEMNKEQTPRQGLSRYKDTR